MMCCISMVTKLPFQCTMCTHYDDWIKTYGWLFYIHIKPNDWCRQSLFTIWIDIATCLLCRIVLWNALFGEEQVGKCIKHVWTQLSQTSSFIGQMKQNECVIYWQRIILSRFKWIVLFFPLYLFVGLCVFLFNCK